jgi:hypothetical protein
MWSSSFQSHSRAATGAAAPPGPPRPRRHHRRPPPPRAAAAAAAARERRGERDLVQLLQRRREGLADLFEEQLNRHELRRRIS